MINTWNESLLHEELKEYYRGERGVTEAPLLGSICDVLNEDGSVTEIQTASLGKLKNKLERLLELRNVQVVYPIAATTLIETYHADGTLKTRRKSPKKGSIYQVFHEITGLIALLCHSRFTLTVQFVDVIELRVADGSGSWRRKGVRVSDRKIIRLHESRSFTDGFDYRSLIPDSLAERFTVKDLATAGAGRYAGKMAWVLRKLGCIEIAEKKGNAFVYQRTVLNKRKAIKKAYPSKGKEISTEVPSPSAELTTTVP